MNDWWGAGAQIRLGGRQNNSPKSATGHLLSLRVYNRVLSDAERTANASLDRSRFKLPVERTPVTLRAAGDGQVSINGSAFASEVSADCEIGSEVTVVAKDGPTASFLMWQSGFTSTQPFDRKDRTVSLLVDRKNIEMTAVFCGKTSGADTRIADYSFDGLLSMWDGISNAGLTNAHDSAATTWKDLAGGQNLSITLANATVVSNALDCLGKGVCAAATGAQNGYSTIEIVMDPPSSKTEQFVFGGGGNMNTRIVATSPSAAYRLEGSSAGPFYTTGTAPDTFAFTYSGTAVSAFYEGGVQKTDSSGSSSWKTVPTVVTVGARSDYPYTGRIYAIRLYDRVLTAAELAQHAETDGIRFFGKRPAATAVVDVRGSGKVRLNDGEPKTSQGIDLPVGAELQLVAEPDAGCEFVAWTTDGADISGTNIVSASTRLTLTPTLKRVTAVFLPRDGRVDKRVTDYAYDGLVAMWDGVCNAGYGLAHDSTTNVWKDLAGTRDLPLADGCGAFAANALSCLPRAAGIAAGPVAAIQGIKTIEILCEQNDFACALDSGYAPIVAFRNGRLLSRSKSPLYAVTTNCATFAFVEDPSVGWTFFENGAESWERDGTESWTSGQQLSLGGSLAYANARLYQGRIFAVRIYNRALTPAEIARHSDLDQRRFFECEQVAADRGVRTRQDGTVECRLRITLNAGGSVLLNGSTVSAGDFWFPEGTSVDIEARQDDGCTFLGWVDDDGRALTPAETRSVPNAVLVSRKLELGAAFVPNGTLRRASASRYVQNGLAAYWDGIENAGFGLPHAEAAAVWKDLSGHGRDWALDLTSNAVWTEQGLALAGTGLVGLLASGAPTFEDADVKHVEFVYANGENRNGFVFSPAQKGAYVYTDMKGHVGFRGVKDTASRFGYAAMLNETNAYSVIYENGFVDRFAVNGLKCSNAGMSDYWTHGADLAAIGSCGDEGIYAKGELMAIRVYNRRLTGYERLLNAKLDAIRYRGEPKPSDGGLLILIK